MTGFSAQWLAMREPVDHRSRDVSLQNKVSSHFEQRRFSAAQPMRIMDLGYGTGSICEPLQMDCLIISIGR